jgi:hypothetical protein
VLAAFIGSGSDVCGVWCVCVVCVCVVCVCVVCGVWCVCVCGVCGVWCVCVVCEKQGQQGSNL